MPVLSILKDNAPNLIQMFGSFAGGFLGAVLVFKSKLTALEINQQAIAKGLEELKDEKEKIKDSVNKELKTLDLRIDKSATDMATVSSVLSSYQDSAKEWRNAQKHENNKIFSLLSIKS